MRVNELESITIVVMKEYFLRENSKDRQHNRDPLNKVSHLNQLHRSVGFYQLKRVFQPFHSLLFINKYVGDISCMDNMYICKKKKKNKRTKIGLRWIKKKRKSDYSQNLYSSVLSRRLK